MLGLRFIVILIGVLSAIQDQNAPLAARMRISISLTRTISKLNLHIVETTDRIQSKCCTLTDARKCSSCVIQTRP